MSRISVKYICYTLFIHLFMIMIKYYLHTCNSNYQHRQWQIINYTIQIIGFFLPFLAFLTTKRICWDIFPNKESLDISFPHVNPFSDLVNPEFSVWGMLLPIYPIYCSSVLIVFCCHCLVHVEKVVCFVYIYHIIISCCTIWC